MNKALQRPAVIILAAGFSDRMQRPKHTLPFSAELNFVEHIIRVYQKFTCSQIVLVVNGINDHPLLEGEGIKLVVNNNPEYGRFHSVQLGLQEITATPAFIQNIDNPFVSPGILMSLEKGIGGADFAVPVYEGRGGHPVLLSQKIIPNIVTDFEKEEKLNHVLKLFERKDVTVGDPYVLVNINTEEDYRRYFSRI